MNLTAVLVALSLVSLICFILVVPQSIERGRKAAFEARAVSNLKKIDAAQQQHFKLLGDYVDSESLVRARLLDAQLGNAANRYVDLDGYTFELSSTGSNYIATATPAGPDTGRYAYFVTRDGVIRFSADSRLSPKGKAGQTAEQRPRVER